MPAACDSSRESPAIGSCSISVDGAVDPGGDLVVEGAAGVLGEPGAVGRLGEDAAVEPPGGQGGAADQDGAGVEAGPHSSNQASTSARKAAGSSPGQDDLLGAEAVLEAVEAGAVGVARPLRAAPLIRLCWRCFSERSAPSWCRPPRCAWVPRGARAGGSRAAFVRTSS